MPTLTELSVDLVVKGLEKTRKDLGDVKGQAAAASTGWNTMKAAMGDAVTKITAGLGRLQQAGTVAFAALSGGLMGFIRSGLEGSVAGEMLRQRWQLLSREIATVFLPTINQVISYLGKAVNWFRNLTGEQQSNYRKWILIGVAVLGVVAVLPQLTAALGLVKIALLTLTNPFVAMAAGIVVATAAAVLLDNQLQKIKATSERLRKQGTTQTEFDKTLAAARIEKVPLIPKTDAEKKQHAQALEDLKKDKEEMTRQLKEQQERFLKRGPASKIGGGLLDLVGADGNQAEIKRMQDFAKQIKAAEQAIKALETGKPVQFAPGEKPKPREHLDMMPTQGFSGFADVWRQGQLAAIKSGVEDDGKRAADNLDIIKDQLLPAVVDAVKNIKPATGN